MEVEAPVELGVVAVAAAEVDVANQKLEPKK